MSRKGKASAEHAPAPPAPPAAAKPRKPLVGEGRRELLDIIKTARAMEERRLNPFHLDVHEALATADTYFPLWQDVQDLTLDARALNGLSRVVRMQEARLRYQAQLFHADPEAMVEKLGKFRAETLARVLLDAWHPVVELEQLTEGALEEAQAYWEQLEPWEERRRERPRKAPPAPHTVTLDDLLAQGVLHRDGFTGEVAALRDDLLARGAVPYEQFVGAPTYAERVRRAYATSYLVSYGYASLARRDGALVLEARGAREPPKEGISLPMVVSAEVRA